MSLVDIMSHCHSMGGCGLGRCEALCSDVCYTLGWTTWESPEMCSLKIFKCKLGLSVFISQVKPLHW